jgi:hypothetical protein
VDTLGVVDDVIAIIVPLVPVVAVPRVFDFVLRVRTAPANHDHLALANIRATRGSRNLRLTLANRHFCFVWGNNFDAETYIALRRTDGKVGRVHFRPDFAGLESSVRSLALAHLDLNFLVGQAGDIRLRTPAQAQNVREIELQLGAGIVTRRNLVAGDDRSVESGRGHVSRVAALRRNVSMDQADACDAMAAVYFLFLRHQIRGGEQRNRHHRQFCGSAFH